MLMQLTNIHLEVPNHRLHNVSFHSYMQIFQLGEMIASSACLNCLNRAALMHKACNRRYPIKFNQMSPPQMVFSDFWLVGI